ncbi:MAG TPA: PspC domain-containing protein, partial [Candidatus Saccharimonadales bacterium]|nr:PspC domain-containing protein [Candidatus Saccharimonadales bacterium]
MARPLTRSTENAYLGGVAAGFARYFDIDPVIARLAFVLLAFLHGVGLILYVICWVVMPAA